MPNPQAASPSVRRAPTQPGAKLSLALLAVVAAGMLAVAGASSGNAYFCSADTCTCVDSADCKQMIKNRCSTGGMSCTGSVCTCPWRRKTGSGQTIDPRSKAK